MRHLVNRRSLMVFALSGAVLIAATSFLHGYSNDSIGLLPPVLTILVAATIASVFEIALQRRTK